MSQDVSIGSVTVARSPWRRLVGMLGRQDESKVRIWFPRCSSIHTCFMRVSIDVVFLDERAVVVKIAHAVRPWRFVTGGPGADSVLEGNLGFAQQYGLTVGDRIECQSA